MAKNRKNTSVGLFEVKNRLSEYVDRAYAGEVITITKRGIPYAKIIPYENSEEKNIEDILANIQEVREAAAEKYGLILEKGETAKDLIEEGRKQWK